MDGQSQQCAHSASWHEPAHHELPSDRWCIIPLDQCLKITQPSLCDILCVTEGFKEAAEKFRVESGIEPSVDLDSLDERIKIREMILKGQIQDAIALINSLHPELLDTNRYLYFHLQVNTP